MYSLEVYMAHSKCLIDAIFFLKNRSLLHFITGTKALYCILSCSHWETTEVGVMIDVMGRNRSSTRSHTLQGWLHGTLFNSFSLCCTYQLLVLKKLNEGERKIHATKFAHLHRAETGSASPPDHLPRVQPEKTALFYVE